jgi:hypothetical protein
MAAAKKRGRDQGQGALFKQCDKVSTCNGWIKRWRNGPQAKECGQPLRTEKAGKQIVP